MARNDFAKSLVEIWGANAAASNFATPADEGFQIADAFPVSYSTPMGDVPPAELFNWAWRIFTAITAELNTRGLFEWDAGLSYVHPAAVLGSDALIYVSVRDNTGVDPTTDTSNSDWMPSGVALSNADIKAAYEANANTNALTDALLGLINGAAQVTGAAFTGQLTVQDQTAGTNNGRAANTRFVQANIDRRVLVVTADPTQANIDAIPNGGMILVRGTTAYSP